MKISLHLREDWCHLCGERSSEPKLDVNYPANAEHEVENVRYLRPCGKCLRKMLDVLENRVPEVEYSKDDVPKTGNELRLAHAVGTLEEILTYIDERVLVVKPDAPSYDRMTDEICFILGVVGADMPEAARQSPRAKQHYYEGQSMAVG